jgi:hypothetical protein
MHHSNDEINDVMKDISKIYKRQDDRDYLLMFLDRHFHVILSASNEGVLI